MTNQRTILSSVLLLQLVISGILFSANDSVSANRQTKDLVKVSKESLTEIDIITNDETLTLIKQDDNWQLAKHPELPIIASKVNALVDSLAKTEVTWPVTSTPSSHERFKLTENTYEKQVVFTNQHGEKQQLLLGSSPSFKKLYVRNAQDDDVFSIEYSIHQASTNKNDWLDKSLLAVNSIQQIKHSVINVEKHEEQWQLAQPTKLHVQEALDTESIEGLVNQLTRLTVTGIAENNYEASDKLTVIDEKNQTFVYSFASQDNDYVVKRNDIEQWFTIAKPKFEQLANISVDKFVIAGESGTKEG